jgi:hypothetical protein
MYLTNNQLDEMAQAAVTSYEFSCSWRDAGRAAREYGIEEWGSVTPAQVATAVRLAQMKWNGARIQARANSSADEA